MEKDEEPRDCEEGVVLTTLMKHIQTYSRVYQMMEIFIREIGMLFKSRTILLYIVIFCSRKVAKTNSVDIYVQSSFTVFPEILRRKIRRVEKKL